MLITIGKVLKPWGIKGEIKIESLTDFPERFKQVRRVFLVSPKGTEKSCAMRSVRYSGSAPLLLLDGFDTPEQAKTITGWLIKIPEEEAIPLPKGQYYWFELLGMEVFAEDGEKLGSIIDIFETGSNDVYVIKHNGKEVYIPATREIVKNVDTKARTMIIHLMEGLMD